METINIKVLSYKLKLLLLIWCVAVGCSSDELSSEAYQKLVPIELTSVIDSQENSTRGIGPIEGIGKAYNISLFRADQPLSSDTYPTGFQNPVGGTITEKGEVSNGLFYLSKPEKKSKLIGLYPAVSAVNVSGLTVTYSGLDGATDILCSNLVEGCKNTPMSTMTFSHLLSKIDVVISCKDNADGKWGNVNSISLVGTKKDCIVTLPGPRTTGSASAKGSGVSTPFLLTTSEGKIPSPVIPKKGTPQSFGCVMFPPDASDLKLSIVTNVDGTWNRELKDIATFTAGKSYKIELLFTATAIEIKKVTINPWDKTDGIDETVEL